MATGIFRMNLPADFSKFDLDFARQTALLAQRAYLPCPCDNVTDCINFESTGIGANYFVQDMGAFSVVSFRGSQSVEDFVQDAKFIETTVDGVGVHLGFWEDFNTVVKQLSLDLTEVGKPFVCTGHSLGASTAIIAGWQLKKHLTGINWIGTYAHEPARCGNEMFKQDYNALCGNSTWVVAQEGDPVPWLPPVITGAKRGGQLAFVADNATIDINPSALAELRYNIVGAFEDNLDLLPNHAIAHCISQLNKAVPPTN
jgi:hypothetical protein